MGVWTDSRGVCLGAGAGGVFLCVGMVGEGGGGWEEGQEGGKGEEREWLRGRSEEGVGYEMVETKR